MLRKGSPILRPIRGVLPTSTRFCPSRQPQVPFRGEADMNRQARLTRSVECDPKRTWGLVYSARLSRVRQTVGGRWVYCAVSRGTKRARLTARARASLQLSLRLAIADLRQAPNFPPPRSTFAHCCRMWAPQSSRNWRSSANLASLTRHGDETSRMCSLRQFRRRSFPGWIPEQNFLRSGTQGAPDNLCCAVAFDDHNMKRMPIIKTIFTMEGPLPRHVDKLT